MNFFSKNKFVFWLLIFLVAVNISALVTIIVFFPGNSKSTPETDCGSTGKCISKELSLTPTQAEKVDLILDKFKNNTSSSKENILNNRGLLLEEIAKESPDTQLVNRYIEEICTSQKQMQKASVNQYISLKEICSPEQSERLSNLYFELYGCQGKCKGAGQGKGMKHRNRHGNPEVKMNQE